MYQLATYCFASACPWDAGGALTDKLLSDDEFSTFGSPS